MRNVLIPCLCGWVDNALRRHCHAHRSHGQAVLGQNPSPHQVRLDQCTFNVTVADAVALGVVAFVAVTVMV